MPSIEKLAKPQKMFKFSEEIKCRAMELMMKVDLNDLISAKFSPLVEAMLFIVVEAISHLDNIPKPAEGDNNETEINTLEYVKDSYIGKLDKVTAILGITNRVPPHWRTVRLFI